VIPELANVYREIILRAVIIVGLTTALCLTLVLAVIIAVVHWLRNRDRTEEPSDVVEYDEAA
jgi:hypothetical protein